VSDHYQYRCLRCGFTEDREPGATKCRICGGDLVLVESETVVVELPAEVAKLVQKLRPEVLRLAEEMEGRLRAHDHDRGDSWKHTGLAWLNTRMLEERVELYDLTHEVQDFRYAPLPSLVWRVAADLANFAMMIADRYGILWRAAHDLADEPAGDEPTA
jgi:DNA-directed RNA polymerase subunit RPC12/RpoP